MTSTPPVTPALNLSVAAQRWREQPQLQQLRRRARLVFALLLVALPMVLSALYIKLFGVNLLFADEFEWAFLFEKYETVGLSWHDLFAQHNEHRILFPRLLWLGLVKLIRWDSRLLMGVSWGLLSLSTWLLFSPFRRSERETTTALLKFAPIAWLMHSWWQHENLLWGFQISFFLVIFFLLLALVWLDADRRPNVTLGVAILAGVVASFSLANGLLVWPVGLFILLVQRFSLAQHTTVAEVRAWRLRTSLWTVVGLVSGTLYFYEYQRPLHHPNPALALQHPTQFIGCFLAFLGAPLVPELYSAMIAGFLLLVLFCLSSFACFKAGQSAAAVLPCALVLYGLLSGLLITIGRLRFGLRAGMASRYSSFSLLVLVGVCYLLVLLINNWRNGWLIGVGFTLFAFSLLGGYVNGWKEGEATWAMRQTMVFYALTSAVQPDENLGALYPDWQRSREGLEGLRRRGYNVYTQAPSLAEARQVTANQTLSSINFIDGQPLETIPQPIIIKAEQKKSMSLSGWAVDAPRGTLAWGVFLEVDGTKEFPTLYGLPRYDVRYDLNNRRYLYSGFSVNLPLAQLVPGRHRLDLKIFRLNGQEYFRTPQPIEIEVK